MLQPQMNSSNLTSSLGQQQSEPQAEERPAIRSGIVNINPGNFLNNQAHPI
jgi:hypothetical protein